MNDKKKLIDNIDKLHTTEMGIGRIKRNLGLELADAEIVGYCKSKILDRKCSIYREGKNWYCEIGSARITVNSSSYTIITAHRMKEKTMDQEDGFMELQLIALSQRPELKERTAKWFHKKWGVPEEAYLDSMEECLAGKGPVPRWYLALSGERIAGGLGVIENDFHDRKDLTPNVCAVYVEEEFRCRGIAGALLDLVCKDMKARGVSTLYLLTDHTGFYERYGWEFLCMARGDGEAQDSRMYRKRS